MGTGMTAVREKADARSSGPDTQSPWVFDRRDGSAWGWSRLAEAQHGGEQAGDRKGDRGLCFRRAWGSGGPTEAP